MKVSSIRFLSMMLDTFFGLLSGTERSPDVQKCVAEWISLRKRACVAPARRNPASRPPLAQAHEGLL